MGLDNPLHIAFLVVILLLVFGARRLPEIGRSLGSGMREFKDSITGESKQQTLPAGQQPQQAPPAQPAQQPAQQAQPAQPVAPPVAAPPAGETQAPEAPAPSGPPAA
jgi:sec-independent protein translocase protein TatA